MRACVEERVFDPKKGPAPWLPDFRVFAERVLGWSFSPKGFAGTAECPIPPELEAPLDTARRCGRTSPSVSSIRPRAGRP